MGLIIFIWAMCALLEWSMHTEIIENLSILQLIYVIIIIILFSPFMIIGDIGLILLETIIGDDYNED